MTDPQASQTDTSGGYVKLYRKTLQSPIWANKNLSRFWLWCLLKASHREYELLVGYRRVHLFPGEFFTGRKAAAKETGLSEKTIRGCLFCLTNGKQVAVKRASVGSVITICNWETYQSRQNEKGQRRASEGPAKGHKQECKEVKERNITPPTPPSDGFTLFWMAWPKHRRKAAKAKCRDLWRKKNLQAKTSHIVAVVETAKRSRDWLKDEGEYIPAPLVWLNQERWDCDLEDVRAKPTTRSDGDRSPPVPQPVVSAEERKRFAVARDEVRAAWPEGNAIKHGKAITLVLEGTSVDDAVRQAKG